MWSEDQVHRFFAASVRAKWPAVSRKTKREGRCVVSPANLITARPTACIQRTTHRSSRQASGGETRDCALWRARRPMDSDVSTIAARTMALRAIVGAGFTGFSPALTSLVGYSEIRNPLENKGSPIPSNGLSCDGAGRQHRQTTDSVPPKVQPDQRRLLMAQKGAKALLGDRRSGIYRIFRKYRRCFSGFLTTDLA